MVSAGLTTSRLRGSQSKRTYNYELGMAYFDATLRYAAVPGGDSPIKVQNAGAVSELK